MPSPSHNAFRLEFLFHPFESPDRRFKCFGSLGSIQQTGRRGVILLADIYDTLQCSAGTISDYRSPTGHRFDGNHPEVLLTWKYQCPATAVTIAKHLVVLPAQEGNVLWRLAPELSQLVARADYP